MKYDTYHIEKYLNGELSQAEVKAFEQEMQSDKDFAYEVKLQQTAVETVQYANFMNKIEGVRKEIEEEKQDVKNEKTVPVRRGRRLLFRRIMAVAAVVLLIPLAYFFIDNIISPASNSDIVQSSYTPIVLDITQMSGGEQELQQAQEAYNSGDYVEALPIFEKHPKNTKVQLAKGNAEYELGRLDAAIATFQKIASGNSEDKSTANWYLALTYLKQDQPEKARAALKEIKSGKYYKDAEKLLKKIK